MAEKHRSGPKVRFGVVVGDKMKKTVVVEVKTTVLNERYKKYVRRVRRIKAHDEKGSCHMGDQVEIIETRPISKTKSWRVRRIVAQATQL